MLPLHRIALSLLTVVCFGGGLLAQNTAPKPLIAGKVNEEQLVTLMGNTPLAAVAKNDAGRVNPSLRMSDLILVLRRSPEQQAAFDAFVASQYDATSPNFHRWLEPAEVGEKFGPALADIATVSNWLESHGLSVDGMAKDRMTIRFSGTAGQVESTFHTELHNLVVKGEEHISNMSDPQIPLALEPAVIGPKALHNFVPRPLHRLGSKVMLNQQTGKWERMSGTSPLELALGKAIPQPEMATNGTGYVLEDMGPADFATIYNVTPLYQNSIDGTGQTIAIAGRSDISTSDVANFRSLFGLPAKTPNILHNGADPGACTSTSTTALCTMDDQVENALDVEWSGAIAKNATIDLVVTAQTSTNDSIYESSNYAITNKTAPVLSVSYGLCELGMGTANNAAYNTLWQTASSSGIAVFVATGDAGSPGCDQGQSSTTPYGAQYGLSVSGMASTPYDTAVGGTDFTWCNPLPTTGGCTSGSPYWASTNDTTTGANAQSYIPEVPWNDTCTTPAGINYIKGLVSIFGGGPVTDAESACNYIANTYQTILNANPNNPDLSFFVSSQGTGGGASNCTTSDGSHPSSCLGGYAMPNWQTGVTGIPTDGKRHIPDVSFFAGAGLWQSAYIICVSADGTCFTSTSASSTQTGEEIGGTSVATPAMAGVMALINQKAGSPQGNPNAELYQLAAKQTYSSCTSETGKSSSGCYFNDIDAGTNAMACASGAPNCTVSTTADAYGVISGFGAGAGYDNATGLGSLNVANVVNAWASSITGTTTDTVSVAPASSSIVSNQSLNVTISIAGSSGTPTGTVTLSSGTYTSGSTALSSGSATITIPANSLAAGTDTLTASYSGDATYAAENGSATEAVTQATLLTPSVAVSASPSSFNSGQGTTVTVTVSGSGATPTGSVLLTSGSFTSAPHTLSGGTTTFSLSPGLLATGTDTITAQYAGDSVYGSANGTTQVTVTQSTFSLVATNPAAISRGSSAVSTITWTTTNSYSSNVSLTSCTLNSGGPLNSAADAPMCSLSTAAFGQSGSGTATVTTKAATTAALQPLAFPGRGMAIAGSGAALALIAFFGIPARKRGWRAMAGTLVLMMILGTFSACGGGGSSSTGGGGGSSDPGTASGQYTFTVKATGTDSASTTASTTFTVTVN